MLTLYKLPYLATCLPIAAGVVLLAPFTSTLAAAQTAAIAQCMQTLMQQGITQQNAAIACSGVGNQTGDCLHQAMYKTYTAISRFANGDYDYGGDYDFLPQDYKDAAGCTSRVCRIGPQIQVQVHSQQDAIALCQGTLYEYNRDRPYPYDPYNPFNRYSPYPPYYYPSYPYSPP